MEVEGRGMRFTGERIVPGVTNDSRDVSAHLARYVWAMHPFCTHKMVLDAAAGTFYGAQILSWAATHVWGIDIEPAAIEYGMEMYQTENMSFVIGDVTDMPFPEGMFDVVVSFETIEHLSNPEKFVDEVWRVLRPNGVFIVSAPEQSGSAWHFRDYNDEELEALLLRFPHRQYYGQGFGQEHLILKNQIPNSAHDTHIYVAGK